jgi:Leucine-rich repeat (LRR) protein
MAIEDEYSLKVLRLLPSYQEILLKDKSLKKYISLDVNQQSLSIEETRLSYEIDEKILPFDSLKLKESERYSLVVNSIYSGTNLTFMNEMKPYSPLSISKRKKPQTPDDPRFEILTSFSQWQTRNDQSSAMAKGLAATSSWNGYSSKYFIQLISPLSASKAAEKKNTTVSEEDDSKIESLDLAVEGIQNFDFLANYQNSSIKRLVLNVNNITSLEGIENYYSPNGCGLKYSLEYLSMSDNKLTSILSSSFQLHALCYLNLDSNRLEDLNLRHLTSLHILSVNCNSLKSFPLLSSIYLTKLELYRNQITSFPTDEDYFTHIPSLLYLNLGRNLIAEIPAHFSEHCQLLNTLILSQNKLENFPKHLRFPFLHSLWLNRNAIPSFPKKSEKNYFLPQLQKFFLQDNQLQSLFFEELDENSCSFFDEIPLLMEVDLSFNHFQSLEGLAPLTNCRFLQTLRLNDNPFQNILSLTPLPPTSGRQATVMEVLQRWLKTHFQFLKLFNGESFAKESIANDPFSTFHRVVCKNKAKRQEFEQLLQLLQLFRSEYDDLIFRNRKKSIKKQSPIEEYQTQLMNEKSMAVLAFVQRKKLLSFLSKNGNGSEEPNAQDFMLYYSQSISVPKPPSRQMKSAALQSKELHEKQASLLTSMGLQPEFSSSASMMRLLDESIQELKKEEEQHEKESQKQLLQSEQQQHREKQLSSSIIKLQACFRGYRLRKKIQSYLKTIHYVDEELDAILNPQKRKKGEHDFEEDDDLFNLEELLSLEEQFELSAIPSKKPSASAGSSILAKQPSTSLMDNSMPSMAYGDHIRKRNNITVGEITNQNGFVLDFPTATSAAHQNIPRPPAISSTLPLDSSTYRPISTPMSVNSAASSAYTIPGSEKDDLSSYPFKSPRELKEARDLSDDWGIADPKILANLMKRSNKVKNLIHAKENREKDKDPQVRYQKFLKQDHKNQQQHQVSGNTFTQTVRGQPRGYTKGKNGKMIRNQLVIPAWMAGGENAEKEDTDN